MLRNPNKLTVPLREGAATTALLYPAGSPAVGATLILGHGAGAGQLSAFMVEFARALSGLGLDLVTFNFLYTEQGRRIPDRGPALEACYRGVIDAVAAQIGTARRFLFIGGKSDPHLPVAGLVLLGYPLHPPGKPAERRDQHLPEIGRPILFVQGTRDAFGTPSQLLPIVNSLRPTPTLRIVADGDHSFKLARKDPAAQAAIYANVQQDVVAWIQSIIASGA